MKRLLTMFMVLALVMMVAGPAFADDAATYKAKCAMCHGADGKGDTPAGKKMGARDFHSPEVSKQSDDEWFKITKDGKGKMPAFKGKISDDEIKGLIKYIRSLK